VYLRGSSHTPGVVSLLSWSSSCPAWSRRGLTRRAWARCCCGIRHALRGLIAVSHAVRGIVVVVVSVTPCVVLSRSHTLCVGLLLSRYPSHPAWSRHGLTRRAWARCCRSIRHALRGLIAVSHAVRGIVVGYGVFWSQCQFMCREVGVWREIIFDFDLLCFNTTGFVRSSSPYHPRGVPIFPVRQRSNRTKERRSNRKYYWGD